MRQVNRKRTPKRRTSETGRGSWRSVPRAAASACARHLADLIATRPAPRPKGVWRQIATGTLPVWPGRLACLAFFAAVALYGLAIGGHFDSPLSRAAGVLRYLANVPGFSISQVRIDGASESKEQIILAALGAGPGDPILWLDTHKAKQRVEDLPWIRSATVLRLLPDVLKVQVEERVPYAIWQLDGELSVIDAEGVVLSRLSEDAKAYLPLVVGKGANTRASALLQLLQNYPELRSRMHAAVRVAERRWNIRLVNGMDIRLPDGDVSGALDELAALDRDHGLLAREIAAVDLRLKDRITLRLTEEAAERRALGLGVRPKQGGSKGGDT